MPTVNTRVASPNDTALTYPDLGFDQPSILYLGNLAGEGDWNHSGLRFTLNIPNGANIVAASLTFTASESLTTDVVRVKIHYEDANDPADFTGDDYTSFEARSRSAISADWDFTTNWVTDSEYTSGDIANVIQALVNEPYWATGEHCVIFVEDDDSDNTAYRLAHGITPNEAKFPVLNVTYGVGGYTHIF